MSGPTANLSEALSLDEVEQQLIRVAPGRTASARASTMNLICCTTGREDAAQLAGALTKIEATHPGRFLLLVHDDEAARPNEPGGWKLRVLRTDAVWRDHEQSRPPSASGGSVDARPRQPTGASQKKAAEPPEAAGRNASPMLQLEGSGRAWFAGASAIAPLLIGELPVFLWWRAESPIDNPRFDDLASSVDRVVLDTHELKLEGRDFLKFSALQSRLRHRCCLADLVWSRVTRWRQLFAQSWEAVEVCRECDVARIRFVACCAQPALNTSALLLAGWLSARLHWTPGRRLGNNSIEMHGPQSQVVRFDFEESGGGTARASLHAVHALSRTERPLFSVARDADRVSVTLGEGGQGSESIADFQVIDPVEALNQELQITGSDPVFQQALEAATDILRVLLD